MNKPGSWAWAQQTGGVLSGADRTWLMRTALKQLLKDTPHIVSWRLGRNRRRAAPIDFKALRAPDTAAARAAETLIGELSPPYMLNHSLRTYWYGRLIGIGGGIDWDDEGLYVASLLHDVAFFGRYLTEPAGVPCFTVRGGQAAMDLMREHGADPARAEAVAEAISFHANGTVPLEDGPVAHLLELGVMMDVTGLNAWRINMDTIAQVLEALPYLDQKTEIWKAFSGEADRHPQCRGHFARRWLMFGMLVKAAPWK